MTTVEAFAAEAATHWRARIVRLIGHRENVVFEMALPGGGRTALRLHRTGYQAPVAIRSELWWCAELAAAGLPVPRPIETDAGDLLAVLSNGQCASAVTWVDGHPIGELNVPLAFPVPRQIDLHHRLGNLLARIHDATDRLTLPDWFLRHRWDRDGLVGETPLWGRFWDHPHLSQADRVEVIAARDFLRDRLASDPALTGDMGLIHADVLRENIFVNGNSLSLIDFDDSGFGFRGYDLGTAMIQNLAEPHRAELMAALTAGYATRRPMTEANVALFTLARVMASLGWAMGRLPPDSPIHKSHIRRAVSWWQTVRQTHF